MTITRKIIKKKGVIMKTIPTIIITKNRSDNDDDNDDNNNQIQE